MNKLAISVKLYFYLKRENQKNIKPIQSTLSKLKLSYEKFLALFWKIN